MVSWGLRKDFIAVTMVSFIIVLIAWMEDFDFLGLFFMNFGFITLALSGRRTIRVEDYEVRVRERGSSFRVEVFRNGEKLWSWDVSDYVEFGDFTFDVRDGGVVVIHRGEEVGRLP